MPKKAPSYRTFRPASVKASEIKKKIRRSDTRPELSLRMALWRKGFRYRKNVVSCLGKPDLVFTRQRTVVFIDGDFWHGRDWKQLRYKLLRRANPEYWTAKIDYNRDRDKRITRQLEELGWKVIRVWETDIRDRQEEILTGITDILRSQSQR